MFIFIYLLFYLLTLVWLEGHVLTFIKHIYDKGVPLPRIVSLLTPIVVVTI